MVAAAIAIGPLTVVPFSGAVEGDAAVARLEADSDTCAKTLLAFAAACAGVGSPLKADDEPFWPAEPLTAVDVPTSGGNVGTLACCCCLLFAMIDDISRLKCSRSEIAEAPDVKL